VKAVLHEFMGFIKPVKDLPKGTISLREICHLRLSFWTERYSSEILSCRGSFIVLNRVMPLDEFSRLFSALNADILWKFEVFSWIVTDEV
jgi:hypothetical protein